MPRRPRLREPTDEEIRRARRRVLRQIRQQRPGHIRLKAESRADGELEALATIRDHSHQLMRHESSRDELKRLLESGRELEPSHERLSRTLLKEDEVKIKDLRARIQRMKERLAARARELEPTIELDPPRERRLHMNNFILRLLEHAEPKTGPGSRTPHRKLRRPNPGHSETYLDATPSQFGKVQRLAMRRFGIDKAALRRYLTNKSDEAEQERFFKAFVFARAMGYTGPELTQ